MILSQEIKSKTTCINFSNILMFPNSPSTYPSICLVHEYQFVTFKGEILETCLQSY